MEILEMCMEGCYSAVFAFLLIWSLGKGARRERHYREVITELARGLENLDIMNGKIDGLLSLCASAARGAEKRKKEKRVCGLQLRETSEAELL